MKSFNVTELDFDKIKAAMVDHFSSQSKYNDWDFSGSGLSLLMDILAYNTHYNGMMAHLVMNEAFLDSAQIRGNVVSHAKLLAYTPRSLQTPSANINIAVAAAGGGEIPNHITLERGTRFSTIIDSKKYSFVTLDSVQAPLANSKYTFSNIDIKQGSLKRQIYRVDEAINNQTFEIPDDNVDTGTMRVRVKDNAESADYSIYTRFSSYLNIDSTSQIYFLQENSAGRYEIYFGDGSLGVKPQSNAVVEIEYVHGVGPEANGATAFTATDSINGLSDITVTVNSGSAGGAERESVESVRYNAPLSFITQNRCVTADDYRAIILREVGNIEAISVWGGEDATTPDYGKVYIAIKPTGAETLTASEKTNIIQNVLKGKNVVSITPVLIDPSYTYLTLEAFFKYNPNLTDRSKAELESLVRETISTYNDDNLEKFDGVFRNSSLLRAIDNSDPSMLNSSVRVYMYKDITPSATSDNHFDLEFSSPIFISSSTNSVLSSNAFKINNIDHYIGDDPITDSINRQIYIYKVVNGKESRVISDAGVIYPNEGRVVLKNFRPDTTDTIRVTALPNSYDLAPKRNQLLSIDMLNTSVTGEIDTIAVAGSSGSIGYTTTSRTK